MALVRTLDSLINSGALTELADAHGVNIVGLARSPVERSFELQCRLQTRPRLYLVSETAIEDAVSPEVIIEHVVCEAANLVRGDALRKMVGHRVTFGREFEDIDPQAAAEHDERLGLYLVELGEQMLSRAHARGITPSRGSLPPGRGRDW